MNACKMWKFTTKRSLDRARGWISEKLRRTAYFRNWCMAPREKKVGIKFYARQPNIFVLNIIRWFLTKSSCNNNFNIFFNTQLTSETRILMRVGGWLLHLKDSEWKTISTTPTQQHWLAKIFTEWSTKRPDNSWLEGLIFAAAAAARPKQNNYLIVVNKRHGSPSRLPYKKVRTRVLLAGLVLDHINIQGV